MSLGNSAGISFSGIGSGIDTQSIVARLIELERLPVQRLDRRKSQLQQRQSLMGDFKARLGNIRSAAGALNNASAFTSVSGSSSKSDVATLTGSSTAAEGSYNLKVYQLASAQKLSSTSQASLTTAMGLTGTFKINGKTVEVLSSDNLSQIASKINSAAGETAIASVLNGGEGNALLTLTSRESGTLKNLQLEDVSGSVLSTLGFTQTSVRQSVANGAVSYGAISATAKLNTFAGFGITGPTNVTVNGTTISVDPTSDDLTTLATKLNGIAGITATVVNSQENGRTVHRLQVVGASGTPTFGGEGNFFTDLGILKRTSEIVGARNAEFSLDGVGLSASSNAVTTAIPGATLTLLKANSSTPEESTLTLSRDTSGIKQQVSTFVNAYNDLILWVKDNSKFDSKSFASGPLFGDATVSQVMAELSTEVFRDIPGNPGGFGNLATMGITFDDQGKLKVDDNILTTRLNSDPAAFSRAFRSIGSVTGADVTFVSSTSKTVASGTGSYAINITQLATKTVATANQAMSGVLAQNETLTFKGGPFGTTGVTLQVFAGQSIDQVIERINSNAQLKDYVVASKSGNTLQFTSTRFGTPGVFTVESDLAAGAGTTGIGTTGQSTVVNGVDLAGTINGEPATGSGQFLTGKDDLVTNPRTAGLQIQYAGSTLGNVGTVSLSKGVAALFSERLDSYTALNTGLVSSVEAGLARQMEDIDDQVESLEALITSKEQRLRARFLAMEQAISLSQAQGQRLAAMLGNR